MTNDNYLRKHRAKVLPFVLAQYVDSTGGFTSKFDTFESAINVMKDYMSDIKYEHKFFKITITNGENEVF